MLALPYYFKDSFAEFMPESLPIINHYCIPIGKLIPNQANDFLLVFPLSGKAIFT